MALGDVQGWRSAGTPGVAPPGVYPVTPPLARSLEVLTDWVVLEFAPADDAVAEAEEGFVDVIVDLPADAQAAEPVQQRDGLFDDVSVHAESGAVSGAVPRSANRGWIPLARTSLRYLS